MEKSTEELLEIYWRNHEELVTKAVSAIRKEFTALGAAASAAHSMFEVLVGEMERAHAVRQEYPGVSAKFENRGR